MSPFKALTTSLARTSLRDPATLFFSFVFPPAMLVILALSISESDQPGIGDHAIADFISPNVMGFGVALVGMFAGAMNIAEWREKGVVRVLRCAPMSVASILASALTVAVATALVQAVLVAVVGVVVPAAGVSLSPWAALSAVPVLLGTLLFYSLGVLVGLAVRTMAAASLAVMAIVVPMDVASGGVTPLELLPDWVQTLSHILPLTYLFDALRWSLTDVSELGDALVGVGVLGVAGVALFGIATRLMRWT